MDVREISPEAHLAYLRSKPSISFLQTPAWGKVKTDWSAISLGWFDQENLVGAGLLLTRKLPKVKKFFGYLPEGPDLDWDNPLTVESALEALIRYAKTKNIFHLKMGPHIWKRRWNNETLKHAIAEGAVRRISDLPADLTNSSATTLIKLLRKGGWQQPVNNEAEFGDFQPRFVFQLELSGQSRDDLFAGFNQLWRRNIRKAEKTEVRVRIGTFEDLQLFHECYVETAKRDGFHPRPLTYFQHMYRTMKAESDERIELFIAQHQDHKGAIAATTLTRVGNHAWYSYGASTTAARELRPSNAIQWQMISHALAAGCETYDLRGISDTLDPNNHLFGLIQFKLGTGGYAQEYVGEWDFHISPLLAKAFNIYMSRRR
ncbi:MAG: peptidoglycan bridge formation glycyltransferase FemA/FemB family protein [Actinobacteria bacterium]|nr:peptidoglycan bridge formation glycyltransferase FemA/FemB family protein [Actinomycetota bacterium]NBY15937.1 peptidoglycan bridge formation glycyltransferase FemA/FemB family protein [Actinomycetota bacterium]